MKPLFASERFSVDSDAEALSDPSGAPDHFERELRCALPDALRFESAAVSGVGTEPLRLLRIERERDAMHVKYVSYAEGGASPVATLSVAIGRFAAAGVGIIATLYDLSTGKRGRLPPAARLMLPCTGGGGGGGNKAAKPSGNNAVQWERCESKTSSLTFTPVLGATSPSFRAQMGLLDFKSEVWADRITVDGGGSSAAVCGTYVRQRCRGTVAFGALWQRKESHGDSIWLFVDPDVNRTGPDRLVFATTPTYRDGRAFHVAELRLAADEPVLEWLHALGQAALLEPSPTFENGEKGAPAGKSKANNKRPKKDVSEIRVGLTLLQVRNHTFSLLPPREAV
jgi:hypothetical protein